MTVQLTLPDEVALDILQQITAGLTKRPPAPPPAASPPTDSFAAGIKKTHEYIENLPIGGTLHVRTFAKETGYPSAAISSVLQNLRKARVVKMVQKGTWEKIASPVALAA